MHRCPHCGMPGLADLAVRWSYRESPARCRACGRLSHVLASSSGGIAGVGCVLLALSLAAGLVLQSYAAGVAGVALAVAHNAWAWRRVELFPISEEAARNAARASWWIVGVAALLKLLSS